MMVDDGESFLGTGWSFPPAFDRDLGKVDLASDEDDVRQSLQILLSTRIGERILEPRYGCDLTRFLFEPLDTTVRTAIKDVVRDAILFFEPRVVLEKIDLRTSPDQGRLDIEVIYRILTTNSRSNLVYPFYLSEGPGAAP